MNKMPATQSSHSSSSLSSFSISPWWLSIGLPHISFSDFLEQVMNNNNYKELMTMLFEQHNFILKTNSIQHITQLIKRLQNEVDAQQQYIQELYKEMEWGGLHELLKKDYICDNGTIKRWRGVHFTLQESEDEPSEIQRPSTPYPQSVSISSLQPVLLWYSPTASQYSPTASNTKYCIFSHSPTPPNVDPSIAPKLDPSSKYYHFGDVLVWQWVKEGTPGRSWLNPIVIDDNWFRESMG